MKFVYKLQSFENFCTGFYFSRFSTVWYGRHEESYNISSITVLFMSVSEFVRKIRFWTERFVRLEVLSCQRCSAWSVIFTSFSCFSPSENHFPKGASQLCFTKRVLIVDLPYKSSITMRSRCWKILRWAFSSIQRNAFYSSRKSICVSL